MDPARTLDPLPTGGASQISGAWNCPPGSLCSWDWAKFQKPWTASNINPFECVWVFSLVRWLLAGQVGTPKPMAPYARRAHLRSVTSKIPARACGGLYPLLGGGIFHGSRFSRPHYRVVLCDPSIHLHSPVLLRSDFGVKLAE